jgi:hypothetical protein
MLAAEHLLDFGGVHLRLEAVEAALEIGKHLFALLRPFEQHAEVVDLLGETVAQLDVFGEPSLALEGLLRVGLVVPEIRRRDFQLELRELPGIVSIVKDSSASRKPASAGRRNGGSNRR